MSVRLSHLTASDTESRPASTRSTVPRARAAADTYRVSSLLDDESWTIENEIRAVVGPHDVAMFRISSA
ncbi:hypothetical protein HALLA_03055 (plasmid) [Halostagnicola larsenii XH-48]|uniref:Uncharacterized protein n=1 Tax=Halostagnicola larsenii XH-48 TaxID=797299 RepID=W0JS07_9EURY|nr:hypothetical protein HALLA_03055 [Halostagnicola larsenii XH-48]